MTARSITSMRWSFTGVVLMSLSIAAMSSGSQTSEAIDIPRETAPAAPYAQATWMKLAELVPTETNAPDVYVRLIAIEGEVLLPVDHVR